MNREALIALRDKVLAGEFPADVSGSDLGLSIAILTPYEAFSGSIDAAKALHEALLPGWPYSIDVREADWTRVWTDRRSGLRQPGYSAEYNNNPARAWLLAILSALIAQQPETEE